MTKRRGRAAGVRVTKDGYIEPLPGRGPNDPTEYEVAAQVLEAKALDAWARRNYRSRYVPEDVLKRLGLKDRWLEPLG